MSGHIGKRGLPARVAGVLSLLLVLVGLPGAAIAAPAAPKVSGQSVRSGHLRVQVLSPTLLRLEYAADDSFENRPTFNAVDRTPGRTWFIASNRNGELRVRTSAVTLRYKLNSGPVTAANTTLELRVGGRASTVHPAFGSPERDDSLGGWYRGLDYYEGQAGPVDQIELNPGMLNRSGWYLLDDTQTAVRTDAGWVGARPERTGDYQDGYLFGYGHDYTRGLADLKTLTGPSLLPPKWALGTWFSKYQAYSTEDYENELLPAFDEHNVPLDSLVMDTDWKAPNQWAGWNWNDTLFPDPESFLADLKQRGINATLNVHAAISGDDPKFAQAQATAKGKLTPATSSFAPNPYRFDWTDPDQAAAYQQLHQPFEEQGVRQWWLDYCCDDSFVSTPGVTADSWINELYKRDGEARGQRGFSLARIGASFPAYNEIGPSGPWAEHRSTVHFTGDTRPDWDTLKFAAAMTPAEASIGESYVSHDIGSFAGTHLPNDLYLRWIQLGAFQPVMRLHSDHGDRLPWEYSDTVGKPAEDFLRLRESLVPYLYTAARQSYDTGLPMSRAMYLQWPELDEAYQHDTQYMLGDSLLVAPVTTPGLSTTVPVWFPPGTWTDFFTGTTFSGPATKNVAATPDHMPVYVRAGGIVTRSDPDENIAGQQRDWLRLTAYPHANGSTSVYDDAGDGLGYRTGQSTRIPVRYNEGRRTNSLTVGPAAGTYPNAPATRRYTVEFAGVSRPHVVTVAGKPARFSYDASKHLVSVDVPATVVSRSVTVTHDGTPLTVAQQPVVDFAFSAPDGLQSGVTSTLQATATNEGPGTITNVSATVNAPDGWVVTPRTPATTASLAPGATFTVTYDVTPTGASPRTAEVSALLSYRNPDGTTATLPAALTVPIRPVAVTFRVLAPPGTPSDATLYVPGNIDELGPWDPAKLAMTNKGNGIWEATITVLDGTDIQYKYTRGSWETVENWGSITGTNNRSVTIDGGVSQTMVVDDTSTAWGTGVPDTHLAIQYWRDPLVLSTATTPTAATITFQRDIQPTGTDYSGSVTVAGAAGAVAGTVAETEPGTLVWTPSSALPAGSYTLTVTQVSSVLADGVPMQKPFTTTFMIP